MLRACAGNNLRFRYVLSDVWYAAAETMCLIHEKLQRYFVMPFKSNRKVALSVQEKQQGCYQNVESLKLEPNRTYEVHIEQLDFPLSPYASHLALFVRTQNHGVRCRVHPRCRKSR
jgi:hypothetical protein